MNFALRKNNAKPMIKANTTHAIKANLNIGPICFNSTKPNSDLLFISKLFPVKVDTKIFSKATL